MTAPASPNGKGKRSDALDSLGPEDFDVLPHGLVRLGLDRRFVAANLAAIQQVEEVARPGATCCAVFGCGRQETALEGICLTRETMERGEALPELRVDIPIDDPSDAVWVTAAPLMSDSGVMLHLRPGAVMDRRRRTEPEWVGLEHIEVCALGRTSVTRGSISLDGDWLDQRAGQVFKYLICERNRLARSEEIAEAIWPMSDPRNALGRVRHYVHAVRDRLEPQRTKHATSAYVVARGGGYTLTQERLTVDVDLFESHASHGLEAFDEGNSAAKHHLERANALYRGEFLADEPFADWATVERERLHEIASSVLRALAKLLASEDNLSKASTYLGRLATLQPFDVQVHRELITMCLRRGRRTEALRRHAALKGRLKRQFGEDLDFTVAELQDELDIDLRPA